MAREGCSLKSLPEDEASPPRLDLRRLVLALSTLTMRIKSYSPAATAAATPPPVMEVSGRFRSRNVRRSMLPSLAWLAEEKRTPIPADI
jgi:hypothetical protein